MELEVKTPVQIIQELLAIHATRLEVAERLKDKVAQQDAATLTVAHQQSEKFVGELMNELSAHGDAVLSSVDKENAYQQQWTSTLANLNGLTEQTALDTFQSLEKTFAELYKEYLQLGTTTDSKLQALLAEQDDQLTAL